MKISKLYYLNEDVVWLARDLLGKFLYTHIEGQVTSGMIVETEAYCAPEDKASHAYNNRRTPRTELFFQEGGIAYIYLCYGIHHLFNIISNRENIPHAILIRAIEPLDGTEIMLERRKKSKIDYSLTSGPGALSMALGIHKKYNGTDLTGTQIWLEDKGIEFAEQEIIRSPRVGIAYAEEWVSKPFRFRVKNNPWTSKAN